MTSTYTLDRSCSWAVQAFGVAGSSPTVITLRGQFWNSAGAQDMTVGAGAAVDDLLVAAVVTQAGATVTPPAGWTTVTAITGSGTDSVLLATFWKIAVSGDLTGTHNFTTSGGSIAEGVILGYRFASALGVEATSSSVSSGDGTTATGPSPPKAGDFTIEIIGLDSAAGSNPNISSFGYTPSTVSMTSRGGQIGGPRLEVAVYDYLAPSGDQWHVGVGSGSGWV